MNSAHPLTNAGPGNNPVPLLYRNVPFALPPKTLNLIIYLLRSFFPVPAECTHHQLSSNSGRFRKLAMQVLSNARRLSRVLKSSILLSSNHQLLSSDIQIFTSSSTFHHQWQLCTTFSSHSILTGTLVSYL